LRIMHEKLSEGRWWPLATDQKSFDTLSKSVKSTGVPIAISSS